MKLKIALFVIFFVGISFIITLNLFFTRSYEMEMVAEISHQQMIIAKTVATTVEDTIEHLQEECEAFSALLANRGLAAKDIGPFTLDAMAELKEELALELVIYLPTGARLHATSNLTFSPQDDAQILGIASSLPDGASQLLDQSEALKRLVIISPVRRDGVFVGAVAASVDFHALKHKFLDPIKDYKGGYAWILKPDGAVLALPDRHLKIEGANVFHPKELCSSCHQSFSDAQRIATAFAQGTVTHHSLRAEERLVAFVRMEKPDWIVCISLPYKEVGTRIKNTMRLQSVLLISVLALAAMGATVLVILNRERVNAMLKAEYADKLKTYANELEGQVQARTQELQSEKEKLDALVNTIEAGICIFDTAHRCIWKNKLMSKWLSIERSRDLTLDYVTSPAETNSARLDAVAADHLIQQVAYMDFGQKRGYFQLAISPLHSPSGEFQFLVLIKDITDIVKAEEQIKQSEKLAAMSRLSAGVAHEIGNPLTSISSYVQMLQENTYDEFTNDAIATIARHIQRIGTIIRDMSNFPSMKQSDAASHRACDLVRSTVELVKYDRRTKHAQIHTDVPEDLPLLKADGSQLVQLFMNLILNAADAMPEGGSIDIAGRAEGGSVVLSFKDTGHGIPTHIMDRIFEPFFTTKETGTGLGLAVSYSIVQAMGGELKVTSIPGDGAEFTVRIPIDDGP